MKAYHIDSSKCTITEVDYHAIEDMKGFVGGHIELAYMWPNGDVLYVDEEGLLKNPEYFFDIAEISNKTEMMAGNGLFVGKEPDDDPEDGHLSQTLPPVTPIEYLRRYIRFHRFVKVS